MNTNERESMFKDKDDISLEKAIKQMNREYKDIAFSSAYRNCRNLERLFSLLRSGKVLKAALELFDWMQRRRSRKHFSDIKGEKRETTQEQDIVVDNIESYTVTVYMCVMGKYDFPRRPLIKYSNYQYILYTDQKIDKCGWEVREIPEKVMKLKNPTKINRYLKMHPDEFFDTDYTFYLDGNIRLLTGVGDYIHLLNKTVGLSMFCHFRRQCLYREGEACISLGKGNMQGIRNQMRQYEKEGMPHDYGLIEATVILTYLQNENACNLLHAWWEEFQKSKSGRDQLALPYILWKRGITVNEVGSLGNDIRLDDHLQWYRHEI